MVPYYAGVRIFQINMEVHMNKKLRMLAIMMLFLSMVLSACTPNMKAYMAKNEEVKTWGPTKGHYDILVKMSVRDDQMDKTLDFTIPGAITMELENQENGKFEYTLDLKEVKKAVAAEDSEEAATLPDSFKMDGYVKDSKAIFNKDIFKQLDDADDFPAFDKIEEKYIAIDMGNRFVPAGTTGPDTIKYLESAEFKSDILKLMDTVFAGYEPVVDYKIEGNTFTYDATIEDLTAETLGIFKTIKKNWAPFVETFKPIAEKLVADTEKDTIDEAMKALEETLNSITEEELASGLNEAKEALKGTKITVVEEFKEDEVVQNISYIINLADVLKMDFTMKGGMKKVDSVNIEYPTDVKVLTMEEYMSLFMTIPDFDGGYQGEPVVVVAYNGTDPGFDTEPIIENGRTLVPFRALLEKLGATVEWNEETKLVTATKDDVVIKLTVGSDIAYVNDKEIKLDVPARIIEDRTLIPLRFFAENLNHKVVYYGDGNLHVINIYSEENFGELSEEDSKTVFK